METSINPSQDILDLESQLEHANEPAARIDLLHKVAWANQLTDPEKGRRYAEEAYALSRSDEFAQQPYLPGLIGSLRSLIALNNDAGQHDLALSFSLQALELLPAIPVEAGEVNVFKANVLGVAAWTYRCLGDYATATEHALAGLKIARELGARIAETRLLNVLSVIYAEANDLRAALEVGQQVVRYSREDNNARSESIGLNNLAMTYLDLGDGQQALAVCQQSLRLAQDNGLRAVAITALATMGEILLYLKELDRAEETLLQGLALARNAKAGADELTCLLNLGRVYQQQQNDTAALAASQNALKLSLAAADRRGEYQSHQLLSEIFESQGELALALHHYKQYHLLKEQVFNESADQKLRNLRISHEVETLKNESDIHRLKNVELQAALEQVQQLSGLLPICANCKKIRDDSGYWQDVAVYVRDHSEAEFSHGICPDCMADLQRELEKRRQQRKHS